VVKEFYSTIKGNSLQIRHKGDDANVIFQSEGSKVSGSGYGI
jgi:hypothetical protein